MLVIESFTKTLLLKIIFGRSPFRNMNLYSNACAVDYECCTVIRERFSCRFLFTVNEYANF